MRATGLGSLKKIRRLLFGSFPSVHGGVKLQRCKRDNTALTMPGGINNGSLNPPHSPWSASFAWLRRGRGRDSVRCSSDEWNISGAPARAPRSLRPRACWAAWMLLSMTTRCRRSAGKFRARQEHVDLPSMYDDCVGHECC
jgi:hypothetical protein